jgi:putative endonuclease
MHIISFGGCEMSIIGNLRASKYTRMAKHLQQGKRAELAAARFLQQSGYGIRERNYRNGKAEVDLIVQRGVFLVFVEIKSLRNTKHGHPEERIGRTKTALFHQAAASYQEEENWGKEIRFDSIAITFFPQAIKIEHFEDAFS